MPVLAPARGGPLDLVHPDDNGWLWPAGEPAVLREQVRALADDPARLATMRLRARASVLGRSWEHTGDELIAYARDRWSQRRTTAGRLSAPAPEVPRFRRRCQDQP
ncbi:MAG: hypothetical protein M3500_11380 [Actinomycetota bacterium]|nr:hypothetical protein [Actinomycetota bacterium]